MIDRIKAVARFLVSEFSPLIAFWLLSWAFGTKVAIAGSVGIAIIEIAWRTWKGIALTRTFMLVSVLTIVFGAIDLMSATPFMLKYESVITNIVTGIFFALGAYGAKPLIQEAAEQREGRPFPERADVRRFFELFTLFWAFYFFVKAAFYFYLAWTLPMAEALALRSIIGGVSLGLMLAFSITQGRRLFDLCRWLGLIPRIE
jgi:intracellular septation protein A